MRHNIMFSILFVLEKVGRLKVEERSRRFLFEAGQKRLGPFQRVVTLTLQLLSLTSRLYVVLAWLCLILQFSGDRRG